MSEAQRIDFRLPILFAADLPECPECGEAWCPTCQMHFADCPHPGPMSDPGDETEEDDD